MEPRPLRILFITHYFPPEVNAPASRTHEHCREWVKAGHQVTVITGVPNHPRGELFDGYQNRWLQREVVDGIDVVRTWMYLSPNEGFARRICNYVLFAVTAVLASFRVPRPDVVIATSPQFFCGLAGMVVSRLRRRPFVLEIRDLWPESIVQLGQLSDGPLLRLLEWIETVLYRSADGIVVNTGTFPAHIQARGIPAEKIELIYNGIDVDLFAPRQRDDALLDEHGLRDKFIVGYLGTLGLAHGISTLVEAAAIAAKEPQPLASGGRELHFLIVGDGAARAGLEAEIAERGLTNVTLLGLQPRSEIPRWIASVDLLVVLLRDLSIFTSVIPSKIFEFLAQERPVVVSAPKGEIRNLVDEASAAYSIDAEQPDTLMEVIRKAMVEPEEPDAMAQRGRRWVAASFDRKDLARRMLTFVEKTTSGDAGRTASRGDSE
jgi:glycosyltransferase involved in cell wall biosynthesis